MTVHKQMSHWRLAWPWIKLWTLRWALQQPLTAIHLQLASFTWKNASSVHVTQTHQEAKCCSPEWCTSPFAITWALRTFQMNSNEQCWATCKAIWVWLQGVFHFRFCWHKNTRAVVDACGMAFFGIKWSNNCGEDGTLGRSKTLQEEQYHFSICFTILQGLLTVIFKKWEITNKISPVVESQLAPDLGIQTPLWFWISHCLQPTIEFKYHQLSSNTDRVTSISLGLNCFKDRVMDSDVPSDSKILGLV